MFSNALVRIGAPDFSSRLSHHLTKLMIYILGTQSSGHTEKLVKEI